MVEAALLEKPRADYFGGIVVILELGIQDKKCRKIAGNFGREIILEISFEILLMEYRGKLKWNPN